MGGEMKTVMDVILDSLEWKPTGEPDQYEGDDAALPYATHEGVLQIGNASLRCFQLSDGRRVFDLDDIEKFFM